MPTKIKAGFLLSLKSLDQGLNIDITMNKRSEVLNSLLLLEYAQFDHRFHKLAVYLKHWNNNQHIKKTHRINNYSLVLMLIAYMQHIQILPNLQIFAKVNKMVAKNVIVNDFNQEVYMA